MPDLSTIFLPRLRSHRLNGFQIESGKQEFIYPNYDGFSILNIPSTICSLFGVPKLGAAPLSEELISPAKEPGEIKKVILIVIDALAFHRMQRWMENETAPIWKELTDQGLLAAITSIVPSTTSAALTSLWTGRSTSEHAITGYEMWMKEYGLVANTILHAPISYKDDVGSLSKAGFDPQAFLPFPTLGTHLAAHGIPTFALQHRNIIRSGLSQMFFDDVKSQGFYTISDLWVNLRHLVENHRNERFYAHIYWSEVDSLSHRYGPDDERTAAEFASLSQSFERLFLGRLSKEARQGTLLLLTADHGQITTRKDPNVTAQRHPEFLQRLHIYPTGENRLAYLYIRPDQENAVRESIEKTWPGKFSLVEPIQAVKAGLFGPGALHPAFMDRIGDLILVARDSSYLWWGNIENPLIGRHGGLHPDEMLVPLLVTRI